MNTIVVLPSFNPDEKLVETVKGLIDEKFKKIVIVDDGSKSELQKYFDGVALFPEVEILRHACNKGKGQALKTAFSHILEKYSDCSGVVTVDGDGQHKPADIVKCVNEMEAAGKVVLGVRNFSDRNIPARSRFGNNLTRFVFRLFCGINISDTQTGLRVIPLKYLPRMLKVEGERYEYETNQLLMMKREDIPFCEVTIDTVYEEGNKTSHFNPIWDSVKIYIVIFKFMASSLCSFFVDIVAFTLINFIIGGSMSANKRLLAATFLARVVSSLVNFSMNHKYVFKSNESAAATLPRYGILCVCQMLLSYGLLYLFAQVLLGLKAGLLESVVKCIVDMMLFLVSFQLQKRWVFKTSKILTKE